MNSDVSRLAQVLKTHLKCLGSAMENVRSIDANKGLAESELIAAMKEADVSICDIEGRTFTLVLGADKSEFIVIHPHL